MKYRPAPHFGLTGMSKHRFDVLFRAVRWSKQPPQRADNESTEQYRWKLVDDFVANFNDHRANFFSPSDTICVDESMSRWYGQGGHWINQGLPQYVAIDRKPENGCEIQNAACGRSGVMLRLKLVKGIDLVGEDDNNDDEPNESSLLHDSYFASVGAAKELYRNGLRFIGVVKTATKGFPKTYLTSVEPINVVISLASDPADELIRYGCVCVDGSGTQVLHCDGRVTIGGNTLYSLPLAASEPRSERTSREDHDDN
ncbi:Transposase IS4 [Fragilaria crotonensis]|nr:Transposase IS4 [Fragilaria crotonensis]